MADAHRGVQVTPAHVDVHQADPAESQGPRPGRLAQRNSLFGMRQCLVVLIQVTQGQS
ncbi:hypothetical protein [Streptomyces sp. NRRL S-920]|uniref:hypothetical protein n=1 Tax=Streptomyces sp. NRRL S-920 TaxID=1463921 RepID=UPI00131DA668|nr:hypothetical protein [Streptomyces sp. NRRL S-920]